MANPTPGGRIIPIVMPRQDYSTSPPSEASQPETRIQTPQSSSEQPSSSRITRSRTAQSRFLELPSLHERGLYALPTEGDGNCLYYALSDQLHGDFTHADEIRLRLADHIAANREYFMNFVSAGGELRRAPRRAAASAAKYSSCSSSSASPAPPSAREKEDNFDSKVAESRRNGVWGGAEEIQAFCQSFRADVNVYTTYGVQSFRDVNAPQNEERQVLHIAFHDFNHYSSVRHTHGPHTGSPCLQGETPLAKEDETEETDTTEDVGELEASQAEEERDEPPRSSGTVVNMATPWKISAIQEGLGGKHDRDTIVEMLQQCRGNIDRAFANLLGECAESSPGQTSASASRAIMKSRLQPSSRSSSPYSTASKRSADDSESEEDPRPAVRRARNREKKRRVLPDVTVGIAFRDDQNDLVSLRLRVSPETVAGAGPEAEPEPEPESKSSRALPEPDLGQQTGSEDDQQPRRSRRITTPRNVSTPVTP